ncbi:hypothetical protein ACQKEK_00785 [Pseudomonas sp. NPDC077408]
MASQLFAKSESQLDIYLPAYKTILSAIGYQGVALVTGEDGKPEKDTEGKLTGELEFKVLPLSAEQKLVWLYVLDRYKFFTDDKRAYFDNQIDIAKACGVSERTVLRFFKDLSLSGYLQINQTRIGGHKSNSYVITRDLELVQKSKEHTQKPAPAPVAPSATVSVSDDAPAFDTQGDALDDAVPAGADWACEAVPLDAYATFNPEEDDDGSAGDAFAYEAFEALPVAQETQEAKPIIVQAPATVGAQFEDMPDKRFCRNGDLSAEMLSWCKVKGIKIIEDDYDHIFVIDGKRHIFNNGFFVQCNTNSAAKPKIEEEIISPF